MNGAGNAAPQELVIVRRRGGGEGEAHHGGVWKIAYADFMTAMMAFFLVMWLINAANEDIRAQVASYFNPVKLTDSSTGDKGLNDPKDKAKKKKERAKRDTKDAEGEAQAQAEEEMLGDPFETLDRVEAQHRRKSGRTVTGTNEMGVDPFDTLSWLAAPRPAADAGLRAEAPEPAHAVKKPEPPRRKAPAESHKSEPPPAEPMRERKPEKVPAEEKTAPVDTAPKKTPVESAATAMAHALEQELRQRLAAKGAVLPANVAIEAVKGGVLLSLTDSQAFGMFEVGSAEPNAETIALVAAIAETIRTRAGRVVIRGHTDARPYRNKKFDNWQLSTARAHMAYYMLVRGGLDEARVTRIEGHSAAELKNAGDPEAAENRRIEILLEGAVP